MKTIILWTIGGIVLLMLLGIVSLQGCNTPGVQGTLGERVNIWKRSAIQTGDDVTGITPEKIDEQHVYNGIDECEKIVASSERKIKVAGRGEKANRYMLEVWEDRAQKARSDVEKSRLELASIGEHLLNANNDPDVKNGDKKLKINGEEYSLAKLMQYASIKTANLAKLKAQVELYEKRMAKCELEVNNSKAKVQENKILLDSVKDDLELSKIKASAMARNNTAASEDLRGVKEDLARCKEKLIDVNAIMESAEESSEEIDIPVPELLSPEQQIAIINQAVMEE